MYVAITGSGKARVIQFREDVRIPNTKKKKTNVIKTIGNYEKMLAEDPAVIEKLREEAKRLTAEKKMANAPNILTVSNQELNTPEQASEAYRFGHAVILQIWKQIGLDRLIDRHCEKRNISSLRQAIQGLLLHRIIDPTSVLSTWKDLPSFAGVEVMGLDVYYSALEVLASMKEEFIEHLCGFFAKNTDRTGPMAYYDVTTYSFESVRQGELRMFGFSKNNKHNEVQVVMGLLIDNNGLPITFQLFPGNTMDQKTLQDAVTELKRKYNLDKIIIVADRGLNGGENLNYLVEEKHDFVVGYSIKRSSSALKQMALDKSGWKTTQRDEDGSVYLCRRYWSIRPKCELSLQKPRLVHSLKKVVVKANTRQCKSL